MNYYLCAYGNTVRWSEKCSSPDDATHNTFGLRGRVADRITVLDAGTRSPRYMTVKQKRELKLKLTQLHFNRTGEKIN